MKLKLLLVLLFTIHQSTFAACAVRDDVPLVASAAGGAGASAAEKLPSAPEEWEAHILSQAQKLFPEDHITVLWHSNGWSQSRSSAWHSMLKVTLKAMDKELGVYLRYQGNHVVLCTALPDTLLNRRNSGDGTVTNLEFNCEFRNLEGRYCFERYILPPIMAKTSGEQSYAHESKSLLPDVGAGIDLYDVDSMWFNDSECLFIRGYEKATRRIVCFLSQAERLTRIFEKSDEDKDRGILEKSDNLYTYQFLPGNHIKINFFDMSTMEWKPTNINNEPTMLGSIKVHDFGIHPEAPDKIVCLRQPRDGLNDWIFFDAEYKRLFEEKVALVRKDWAEKEYPFKDALINFTSLQGFLLKDSIAGRNFNFPFGSVGNISIAEGGKVDTMIGHTPDLYAFRPKPYKLQRYEVLTEDGYALPYYTIDAMGEGNTSPRSTLWWIQGGPSMEFEQDEDILMDWFLRNNFLVVIPRERIRKDLGHDHLIAGIGKLHEQGLLDAMAPVNDLIGKGIVDPTKVIGYGMSYGGYAMASFATRWKAFEEKARFKPLGLIAEAAFLAPDPDPRAMEFFVPKGAFVDGSPEYEAFLQSFFPLYQPGLELPLLMTHGIYDHRCPIAVARVFYEKFKDNPLLGIYMEHPKPHAGVVDAEDDDLGVRILQNMASSLMPTMIKPAALGDKELAAAGIDIKKGGGVLGVTPSIP